MTPKSAKVERCYRCGKRHRGQPGWNEDYIASLVVGVICPDCQTAEEDLGAEVNLTLAPPSERKTLKMDSIDARVQFIHALIDAYPTPEIMRDKADRLATARNDPQASEVVRVMREIADDMESGELWEPAP